MIFYLAWVDEGVAFNPAVHATVTQKVWDGTSGAEIVFSLEVSHAEGDFPALRAELINPRVGLLSAGRNQWVWLSEDSGAGAQALFNGRIIGVPQRLADEIVEVEFVARPPDFVAQKEALAATLRELPWWDPVWLQEAVNDPETVLETRTARWHIDRLTLDVTTSDIIAGEDGQIEIGEADHLYDDFEASYGEAPLRRVRITGTVSWTQQGAGEVDLTPEMIAVFQAAGSPYAHTAVASLTGDGLLSDWPEPLADIGGGWSVGAGATIEHATWLQGKAYVVQWVDKDEATIEDTWEITPIPGLRTTDSLFFAPFANWEAAFPLDAYKVLFPVHFEAARERSETVTATIEADVQPLIVDPGAAEEETIDLASEFVGEPVDGNTGSPSDMTIPIGDLRRNTYYKSDRGAQSFEYLLLLARAKLVARARSVIIKFVTPWEVAEDISCRHNVHLIDNRLPGGEAIGKVTQYTLSASGEGEIQAEITIGCTIGYGVALGAAATGTPSYVNDNYVNDGYQQRTGGQATLIAGELLYESFDNFEVTDDDGVNLLDMTARTVVNSLTVAGGPTEQRAAIDAALNLPEPDPIKALEDTPTVVTLDLVPVDGGAFHVDYDVTVSELVVPMTIDLAAA
jgi:hypothetical protein